MAFAMRVARTTVIEVKLQPTFVQMAPTSVEAPMAAVQPQVLGAALGLPLASWLSFSAAAAAEPNRDHWAEPSRGADCCHHRGSVTPA